MECGKRRWRAAGFIPTLQGERRRFIMLSRQTFGGWSQLAGLFALFLLAGGATAQQAVPSARLEESLRKATVNGKYEMLLRQIKVENDAGKYPGVHELGFQERRAYAGHADLPRGHWVYVAPYWYIWRDLKAAAPRPKRNWGPEQAIGPPDTWPLFGDRVTAWASLTEDGQDEWLLLEYPEPVVPHAVVIYATYNPGAIGRVTVFRLDGEEVEVWKGQDPTPVGSGKGISVIPIKANFKTNRVKLYINSRTVGGWNEIDAVGLRCRGRTLWASAADASSTYAQMMPVAPVVPDPDEAALTRLENEVRQLKDRARRLEERIKKRKKTK